ncbi:MAG: DNA double-strand break repair Rad50 ATPase [Methanobacterium sp. PtaU1.Bin242]|nr:MAG: DNA double-strand break repair Rad50 ATPase [Methanobacterium sp. PtaU1.Bin242]
MTSLKLWWDEHQAKLEALPDNRNVYDLYHAFSATITAKISSLGILDEFKCRGAFAGFWNEIFNDLRSVAASGWNAELIPDDEILQSQFPEVIKELNDCIAKRDELEALFNEVNELEDGAWSEEEYEVFPKEELAEVKATIKSLGAELKELSKDIKNKTKQIKALKKSGEAYIEMERALESLQKHESELKKINVEIPHIKRQINDKEELLNNYNHEIKGAEEENQQKFIPEIEKLEKSERPTRGTEADLKDKITQVKEMVRKRDGLLANLNLLNENKLDMENKLDEEKNKSLSQLQDEIEVLNAKIEKQTKTIDSHLDQIQKVSDRIYKLEARKDNIDENLKNLNDLGDLCPICGSRLDEEHKRNLKNEKEKEIKKINSEVHVLSQVKLKGNDELESFDNDLKDYKASLDKKKILIDKISQLNFIKDKIIDYKGVLRNIDENLALIIGDTMDFDGVDQYISNLETLLERLKDFLRSQDELKELKYQLEKNVEKINAHKKAIQKLTEEIHNLRESLSHAEERITEITVVLKQIDELKEEYDHTEKEFQSIKEKIISTRTLINSLNEDIDKVQDDIIKKERLRKQLDKLKDYHIWLNDYLIPTLSVIEKHVMQNIHLEFNENFQKWFTLLMDDPSKTGKINEEFTPIIEQDGFEQDIDYLSGGEKTSVALAYRLALNNIVKKVSTGMKSNLLVLDEPTDGFSKEQLFKVREILNELNCPQIIIVSHERELESFADYVFRIEKVDGISEVSEMN